MQEGFLDNVIIKGNYFQDKLRLLKEKFPGVIVEIRGKGLIIGMELKEKGSAVQRSCQEKGLLVNCIGDRVLRFLPPLNVSRDELDEALEVLSKSLEEVFSGE